jgi:hypothetical protein
MNSIERKNAEQTSKRYHNKRHYVIKHIRELLAPLMWVSGYVDNITNSGLCVYVPDSEEGAEDDPTWVLEREYDEPLEVMGFTPYGVITDSYCAIVTEDYLGFDLDTLLWLYDIVEREHAEKGIGN